MRSRARTRRPGSSCALAGAVATNVANQASSQRTGSETQTVSFVFIIVLLLLIFRSVLAPLITLLPAGISLVVSMRLIGELGAHGLKISEITELLLIILILGAGTDYGLFLVFRVREEIRRGLDDRAAVEHALVRVGESITRLGRDRDHRAADAAARELRDLPRPRHPARDRCRHDPARRPDTAAGAARDLRQGCVLADARQARRNSRPECGGESPRA